MIKVIGIDPDMRKPGLCFMHDGVIHELISENMNYFINSLRCYIHSDKYRIAIEDVNKNNPTYSRGRQSQKVKDTISQRVGMVKCAATIITDLCDFYGEKVILVPPGIGKQTKRDAALFKRLTGYTGRTNEDTRDAYWIAHYAYKKLKGEK